MSWINVHGLWAVLLTYFSPLMFFELNRSRDLFYYSRAALCSTAILAQACFFFFYRQLLQQLGLWNTRRRLSLHYVLAIFSCLITSIFRTANPADLCHFSFPTHTTLRHQRRHSRPLARRRTTEPAAYDGAGPAFPENENEKNELNRTLQCPRGTFTTEGNLPNENRELHATPSEFQYVFSPNTLLPLPRYNNCAV